MANEKLRVLTTFPLSALQRIVATVPEVELIHIPEQGELEQGVAGEVLLTPPWDTGNLAHVLTRGVQWVHTIGTGVDRMPFDLVGDRLLTCARGASSVPIAEWVMAVMLAFEKQLPESWLNDAPQRWGAGQLGSLHGKTLGLVGLGGIGSAVARHALSFGMRVLAYRRSDQPSPVEGVESAADLDALLAVADHVVLALPLTRNTRHLIDSTALAHIPAGAGIHLVNPSRGGLVDHEALREALDDGRIARASLDTVEPEPLPSGHWLYAHPAVKLSPHISWSVPNAFDLLLDTFIENLVLYRLGEPLTGMVDREQGY
jgi:phosphoglycerate dehydrogenase-like enzyme